MVVNAIIENDLVEIKKHKLDVMILQRKNEELCKENNKKIAELNYEIGQLEIEMENNLRASGLHKVNTPIGYASFRAMPDKWEYDEPTILAWCKEKAMPYYKVIEVVKKQELKDDIKAGKLNEVPGIVIEPQESKFIYKIKEII